MYNLNNIHVKGVTLKDNVLLTCKSELEKNYNKEKIYAITQFADCVKNINDNHYKIIQTLHIYIFAKQFFSKYKDIYDNINSSIYESWDLL